MGALKSRLVGRGTETAEAVERRFKTAYGELAHIKDYDYIIVNDVLDIDVYKRQEERLVI